MHEYGAKGLTGMIRLRQLQFTTQRVRLMRKTKTYERRIPLPYNT
ncbi:MAG: hypothetical protein ACLRMX_12190 [Lachnospira eligens]